MRNMIADQKAHEVLRQKTPNGHGDRTHKELQDEINTLRVRADKRTLVMLQ